jgi:hypothetical protein
MVNVILQLTRSKRVTNFNIEAMVESSMNYGKFAKTRSLKRNEGGKSELGKRRGKAVEPWV